MKPRKVIITVETVTALTIKKLKEATYYPGEVKQVQVNVVKK